MGGERSGYASTGMLWNAHAPPNADEGHQEQDDGLLPQRELNDAMNHRPVLLSVECELANCRKRLPLPTTLSPAEMPFTMLRLAALGFAQFHVAPAELVIAGERIDKGLIVVVAQNGGVGHAPARS